MTTLTAVESLYAGPVGDSHCARVEQMAFPRYAFWHDVLCKTVPNTVLECGIGVGKNAQFLAPQTTLIGVDISTTALTASKRYTRRLGRASAAALPFCDRAFDLVVSSGLLMHVDRDSLDVVMGEQARVARKYVLLCEYSDTRERMIPWHGVNDALWARPTGALWWNRNPHFVPVWRKSLTAADGFKQTEADLFMRRT